MEALPPFRMRARNLATASENRIHDDAVARQYGFRGGLVPGITTYDLMTRPVMEALGPAWLERGTMAARFRAPVYDGDLVTVRGTRSDDAGDGVRVELSVEDESGATCATGEARLPASPGEAPDPARYPEADLPAPRPEATREHLEGVGVLGTVRRTFRGGRVAGPGWLVYDANQALARNVALGPWIHVGTEARHFSTVHDGDVVATRGRVASVFERKGHELVELDLLMVVEGAGSLRPVWHLRHTAIYRMAVP